LEEKIIQERKCLAGVYANHNLRLARIHVYGFDYDYTLAHYTNHLQFLIYNLVKAQLVTEVRVYPIPKGVVREASLHQKKRGEWGGAVNSTGTQTAAWTLNMM
jgi:hypothetical protein